MRLGGGRREKGECVVIYGEGEHGERGNADKETAPLKQATYLLQKATQIHKSWGQEMY